MPSTLQDKLRERSQQQASIPSAQPQQQVQQPQEKKVGFLETAKQFPGAVADTIKSAAEGVTEFSQEVAGVEQPKSIQEIDNLKYTDKYKYGLEVAGKAGFNIATGLLKATLKAPVATAFTTRDLVEHSTTQQLGQLSAKSPILGAAAFGFREFNKRYLPEGDSVDLPWLGETGGYDFYLSEADQMGLGPGAARLYGTANAIADATEIIPGWGIIGDVGKYAGKKLLRKSIQDELREQSIKTLSKDVAKKSFGQTEAAIKPIVGEGDNLAKGATLDVGKQANPDIRYMPVSTSFAKQHGGTTGNTFLKYVPGENGTGRISVIQKRKKFNRMSYDELKAKYGNRIKPGEDGFELEVDAMSIKPKAGGQAPAMASPPVRLSVNDVVSKFKASGQSSDDWVKSQFKSQFDYSSNISLDLDNPKITLGNDIITKNNPIYESTKKAIAEEVKMPPIRISILPNGKILIRDGNHRLTASRELGKKEIPAIFDREALAKIYDDPEILNKSQIKGEWNMANELASTKPEIPRKTELPELVVNPPKGSEDLLVPKKDVRNIRALADERRLTIEAVDGIATALTGKSNLNDLTRLEAFQVSEAIKGFPEDLGMDPLRWAAHGDSVGTKIDATFQAPNKWMQSFERKTGIPLWGTVYNPVDNALRNVKKFRSAWQEKGLEIFGKYADEAFGNERRMITQYIEGDKAVILKNTAIDDVTKKELVEVADKLTYILDKFKKMTKIQSDRFDDGYILHLSKQGGRSSTYKSGELPSIADTFRRERKGGFYEREMDSMALFDAYVGMVAKDKHLKPVFENIEGFINKLPETPKKATIEWLEEVVGHKGKVEQFIDEKSLKLSDTINTKFGKNVIPANVAQQAINYLVSNTYAGLLGLPRIMPIIRGYTQPFIMGAELDSWVFEGVKRFTSADGEKIFLKSGLDVEMGIPYGKELAERSGRGMVGKAVDKAQDVNSWLLKAQGNSDLFGRGVIYHGVVARFEDAFSALNAGKINTGDFFRKIDMDGFGKPVQDELMGLFRKNTEESIQQATDLMAREIIDRTMFPFRKGASGQMFHGLKGKALFQFGQHPMGMYTTIIRDWAMKGRWDKLIKFFGMSELMRDYAEDTFNVDVSNWVAAPSDILQGDPGGLFGVPVGLVGSAVLDGIGMAQGFQQGRDDIMNENAEEILRTLKTFGGPIMGIGARQFKDYFDAVERMRAGVAQPPDPSKPFPILSKTNKLIKWGTFSESLRQVMGFSTTEREEQNQRIDVIRKETDKRNELSGEAMNLFVDGKFQQFDKFVRENKIPISNLKQRLKSYNTPLDQRMFDSMPMDLKIKYSKIFLP